MTDSTQARASREYRERLSRRGMARFEVIGRDQDRDLIRELARRLAQDGPEAADLRASVARTIGPPEPARGGVYRALRRSPLVGADLDLTRQPTTARDIDL